MTLLIAGLLGLVEGLTEFLPVSSTGHLILAGRLLGLVQSDFLKSFEIIIQLGAILAVVVLYWKQLWSWPTIKKLFVAFLPTAIIGFAAYKLVKTYLLGSEQVVLGALFLGGVAIICFEWWFKTRPTKRLSIEATEMGQPTYKQAAAIGLFQAVAIIPGVSRSAATIIGGLWLGLSRPTIVEFSFLLAVPTMLAATGLDLVKNFNQFSADQFDLLAVGFLVSFIVALGAIKFLLSYVRRYDFTPFGVYRIAIALLFWLLII
jgi:undecaprenyl-diphosphatase